MYIFFYCGLKQQLYENLKETDIMTILLVTRGTRVAGLKNDHCLTPQQDTEIHTITHKATE